MKNAPLDRCWMLSTFAAWLLLPIAILAQTPPPAPAYDPSRTAILLVDPYNDFLAEGGKLWPLVKSTADSVGLHEHLKRLLGKAREAGVQIVYVPHHHTADGDFDDWKFLSPSHIGAQAFRVSRRAVGVPSTTRTISPSRGIWKRGTTGPPAGSQTPISTSCSSRAASITLCWPVCVPTPASSPRVATPWSSAIT